MDFTKLTAIATKFASELPAQVTRSLEEVEILVCEDVTKATARVEALFEEKLEQAIPADTKGIFIGDPMEVEESDDSEQEEVTIDPQGLIVVIASNIASEEEAAITLLHETAHAMGWDEEEVARMGLGFKPSETGDKPREQAAQSA